MKQKRAYFAMPSYDGQMMGKTFETMTLFLAQGTPLLSQCPYIDQLPGESSINRARNRLAKKFLNTDCTHLLFIDKDIIFDPSHLFRILEHDKPIVGGLYCGKEKGAKWVINTIDENPVIGEDGLAEVKCIGTGFMLIAREVFEAMIANYPVPHFELFYDTDNDFKMGRCCDFFHQGVWPGTNRFLTEDWWFCYAARALGLKVYADTKCKLVHRGEVDYPIEA